MGRMGDRGDWGGLSVGKREWVGCGGRGGAKRRHLVSNILL